jgi:hypothetical protein
MRALRLFIGLGNVFVDLAALLYVYGVMILLGLLFIPLQIIESHLRRIRKADDLFTRKVLLFILFFSTYWVTEHS